MPSKEQKKIDKRELQYAKMVNEQQKLVEEMEWEKGTDQRSMLRRQQQNNKLADKMRKKRETQELLEQDESK